MRVGQNVGHCLSLRDIDRSPQLDSLSISCNRPGSTKAMEHKSDAIVEVLFGTPHFGALEKWVERAIGF